jgi:UDP-N-acetylmuramyl-tripeptide synthetase
MPQLHTPAQARQWLKQQGCTRLSTDSRTIAAGDAFIAWPGAQVDARKYVASAITQGANACLVEHEGAQSFGFASENVATYLGLKADTGAISSEFLHAPSQQLALVAITGTNGKTSSAWWLAQALSALPGTLAMPCGMVGTLGVGQPPVAGANPRHGDAASDLTATGFTTPDPVVLQQTLRKFVDDGLVACAIEASSIGIEERRLDGTHIRVAVFANFTQDHLDYHGSMQAYWQSKAKLFSWPGLASAVINIDDNKGAELAQQLSASALDLWTVSAHQTARLQAQNISHSGEGLRFDVVEGELVVPLQTFILGDYNILNLLGVLAAMRALGIALPHAVQVVSTLRPVPGRMECFGRHNEPLVAVDYAHTPDALGHALAALRPLALERGGTLWCVFGCGGDRDASKRPLMGAIAVQQADHVVVTSDNPRSERPEAIIAQVLLGAAHSQSVEVMADRAQAIADVLARAHANDVVLLAGKGHEQTQEIAGTQHPFSDQDHVAQALQARRKAGRGQAA